MRSISKYFAGALLIGVLAGCASTPPPAPPITTTKVEYVYAECGQPPERTKVRLRALSWQVIDGRFTLSARGYEDLSANVNDILRAINEYNAQLEYYERCLEDQKSASKRTQETENKPSSGP